MSVVSELMAAVALMPRSAFDRAALIVAHKDMFEAIQKSFEKKMNEGTAIMATPPTFDLQLRESEVLQPGWAIVLDKNGQVLFTIRPDSVESQEELVALSKDAANAGG